MQNNIFISTLLLLAFSAFASILVFNYSIKFSRRLGLVDKPNHRKVHRKPIPVVGGFAIGFSLFLVYAVSHHLQQFVTQHCAIAASLLVLLVMGIFDDKYSLSVKLRLGIELLCAFAVAYSGIRLTSLHGLFGIQHLPVLLQYIVTIFLIVSITNAFNLMDGIDGLVGAVSLVNTVLLSFAFIMLGEYQWLYLMLPLLVSLLVFLSYNWNPAKIFMGDAGSLLLGFLFTASGIFLIEKSFTISAVNATPEAIITLVSACLMIPVMDTIRVFVQRAKQGKSPFAADKTHLHHLFLSLNISHANAAKKILLLHCAIIFSSVLLIQWMSVSSVIMIQVMMSVVYTVLLKFVNNFFHWFRFIRKYELE